MIMMEKKKQVEELVHSQQWLIGYLPYFKFCMCNDVVTVYLGAEA